MIRIIESPREGMQGFPRLIPAREKAEYISQLLKTGFDTVEIGSFVSPRFIPQMADSLDVIRMIDFSATNSSCMFLVVNTKGAECMVKVPEVSHLSFPFSFSPTFLKHNVNRTVDQYFETAGAFIDLCHNNLKSPVIYMSMAFGNPYGDPWSIDKLAEWCGKLHRSGARTICLSNVSIEIDASVISEVFSHLIPDFPDVEFGLHLHTSAEGWHEKVDAAFRAGCRRFDSVIHGLGGCPMSGDKMLGNLATQNLVQFASEKNMIGAFDLAEFEKSCMVAEKIFKMS